MSMLKSFFEIGTDKSLFDGLYISGNKELCEEYMGKYPVVFLSLKSVEGTSLMRQDTGLLSLSAGKQSDLSFLRIVKGFLKMIKIAIMQLFQ